MNYDRSMHLYRQAAGIPGRSMTRSKAPGRLFEIGKGPLYAAGVHGSIIVDVDGNEFIDMICGLGAISLGYVGLPLCDDGVTSLPFFEEVDATNTVLRHVAPWATSCKFVKTGSEATHAAYRIAKRATGRPFVLIGRDSYHGWHAWSERRPDGQKEDDHTLLYKHGADLEALTRYGPEEVAAVFVEPHRWEFVDQSWLQTVRDWCTKNGSLLIFDEMIYGGRWALGGATECYGVKPDIACFGKAIGNGASVACVVGNWAVADHGEMVSGTYSGDRHGLRAVIDTVQRYVQEPVIETIWERGYQLKDGLDTAIYYACAQEFVVREGAAVHQRLTFKDQAHGLVFAAEMAARGVLWHPAVVNVCAAHTTRQIETVIAAANESLHAVMASVGHVR